MAQMNLSTGEKNLSMENRLVVAKREEERMNWIGNVGLTIAFGMGKKWDPAV